MKKQIISGLFAFTALTIACSTITFGSHLNIRTLADDCNHVGFHYDEKSATDFENGVKEYWVCCNCHEHFLEAPIGDFEDNGIPDFEVDENDDRFIGSILKEKTLKGVKAGYKFDLNTSYNLVESSTVAASQLFTKADLPVGSKLVVNEGYKVSYCGMATLDRNTKYTYPSFVTGTLSIDSSVWGSNNYLGLNIAKVDDSDITETEAKQAIKIYAPRVSYIDLEDITYLTVVNLYTWSTMAPELTLAALGTTSSDSLNLFTNEKLTGSKDWFSFKSTSQSGSELGFTGGHAKTLGSAFMVRFAAAGKVAGQELYLKKGIVFENGGRKFMFDRDYSFGFDGSSWSMLETQILSLDTSSTYMWTASGNVNVKINYNDEKYRFIPNKISNATCPVYAEFFAGDSGVTYENIIFNPDAAQVPTSFKNYSGTEILHFRFKNAKSATGYALKIYGNVEFTINGMSFAFDKDYTFTRTSAGITVS